MRVSTQSSDAIADFVRESNKIEGIHREPLATEVEATRQFIAWPALNVPKVKALVAVYAPGKLIRNKFGMDVRVGLHVPPYGGEHIPHELGMLLLDICANRLTPYEGHQRYEALHPFMDGNGRSGRAIWLWHMLHSGSRNEDQALGLGFLHSWYYQSLQAERK